LCSGTISGTAVEMSTAGFIVSVRILDVCKGTPLRGSTSERMIFGDLNYRRKAEPSFDMYQVLGSPMALEESYENHLPRRCWHSYRIQYLLEHGEAHRP
jgi:hypothetical protein